MESQITIHRFLICCLDFLFWWLITINIFVTKNNILDIVFAPFCWLMRLIISSIQILIEEKWQLLWQHKKATSKITIAPKEPLPQNAKGCCHTTPPLSCRLVGGLATKPRDPCLALPARRKRKPSCRGVSGREANSWDLGSQNSCVRACVRACLRARARARACGCSDCVWMLIYFQGCNSSQITSTP